MFQIDTIGAAHLPMTDMRPIGAEYRVNETSPLPLTRADKGRHCWQLVWAWMPITCKQMKIVAGFARIQSSPGRLNFCKFSYTTFREDRPCRRNAVWDVVWKPC